VSRKLWLSCSLLVWGCGRIGFAVPSDDAGVDSRVVVDDAGGDAGDASDSRAVADTGADAMTGDTGVPPTGPVALEDTGIDLSGLVAHWAFDVASAMDGAAFPAAPDPSLVATLESGDATDVIAPGKIGTAIDFDGVDDRLVAADAPAFDIAGPLTLTAWINMDRLPVADDDFGIVEKEDAYSLEIETDTTCIDLAVYRAAGGFDELDPTGCALAVGEWHHLAAVYDGSDLVVYQNGVEVGTMPFTGTAVAQNDLPVYIGHNTFRATRFMDGRIDEVTIWSRALSREEVQTIERLQRPGAGGAP